MTSPLVSLVVRSRSETGEVLDLLDAVSRQTRPPGEIVLIDSGSSRELLERLREGGRTGVVPGWFGVRGRRRPHRLASHAPIPLRLIEIDGREYQSARALNRAIGEASGDLVAIFSQDAVPADEVCLERLAGALDSGRVAGAYARQIPADGADPLVAKDLATTYPGTSRVQSAPDCWFVNTCSMIRRDLWRRFPFEEQAITAEDHLWARRVQAHGFVVKYEARAVVRHHHDYRRWRDLWGRFHDEGQGLAFVHGSRPGALAVLAAGARETASDAVWLARTGGLGFLPRAVARRAVKHAALYCGGRRTRPSPPTGRRVPVGEATTNGSAMMK